MVNVLKNTDISIYCDAWSAEQNQLANELKQHIHFGPCDPQSRVKLRIYSQIDVDQSILSIYNLINSKADEELIVNFQLRTSYNKILAKYVLTKAEYQLCQGIPCFNTNEYSTKNYGDITICWYLT